MTDLLSADALARQRALDPASFIVEAPAGAGKTELLTQRTLRLLAMVDHPEEVVALTFTNKAATEMRDRILGSLELAASGQRPGDDLPHKQLTFDLGRAALARDAERGWQLLAHPGRLAITTLDALCGSLARQMPLLSRFGAQPGIAEDADEHYRSAARRTLAMLEEESPAADIVAAALDHVDNHHGRLESLLIQMLGRRDQWLGHTARTDDELRAEAEAGLAALIQRDLERAAAALSGRWQQEAMPAARFAANTLAAQPDNPIAALCDWQTPLQPRPEDLPRWHALAELVLSREGTLRKRLDVRNGLPATPEGKIHKANLQALIDNLGSEAESALHALRGVPPGHYDDVTWAAVVTFSRLLNLAAAQLWLVFQEAGLVDFSEISQRALQALGSDESPTDLALALDYRIRHLLVDEFQDTSPTQVRLIGGLTRGWSAGDGRTLFLVGDPMQSIYRFRKADVGLFLKVRDNGIGSVRPERLRLTRNNRSLPSIVDWVNREFPAIFPSSDDPLAGGVRYSPSVATKTADGGGVHVHPLFDGDADAEARQMLDVICTTRQQRPQETIAVLVRARSHLEALVSAMRREAPELRFQAVETEALSGLQAVQDVLSLSHALLHRADRVHWLAILRAPWCGLTLADLHTLAADDHAATVWTLLRQPERIARLSDDGQTRVKPLISIFSAAFAHAGRQHPRRWIEGVWRALGGPRCLTSQGDQAAIEALFALIDALVAARRFNADTLAAEAENLFAPADADPEAGRLQLMTIHKSKGLEFDTVLLPGLHRGGGRDGAPLLVWDEIPAGNGAEEYLIAAPLPRRGENEVDIYHALRRQEAARSRHESERLLYVAATRARRELHLFASVSTKDGKVRAPNSGTLLALLWPGQTGQACITALAQPAASPDKPASPDQVAFTPALLRLPRTALASPLPADAGRDGGSRPSGEISIRTLETSVGTLVHRCLELIAQQGLAQWPAERIAALRAPYAAWLRGQGHRADEAEQGASNVISALQTALGSTAGQWLLQAHPEQAAELAMMRMEEDGIRQHVIDRLFIDQGERWIIDYKTVHWPPTPSAEALQNKAEEYREQLERYASLLAGENLPQRLAIFFVAQGQLIELKQHKK